MRKIVSGVMLTLLLTSMLTSAFTIQAVNAFVDVWNLPIPLVPLASKVTIDGQLTDEAWCYAKHFHAYDTNIKNTIEFDVYLMHDNVYMYIATKIYHNDFWSNGPSDSLQVEINDRNDRHYGGSSGNDVKQILVTTTGIGNYEDYYIPLDCVPDVSVDGEGAFTFSGLRQNGELGDYYFELKIPIKGSHPEDANLNVGIPFAMNICFFDYDSIDNIGYGHWLVLGTYVLTEVVAPLRVCIDPGHDSTHSKPLNEAFFNLDIGLRLRDLLKAGGWYAVFMTRETNECPGKDLNVDGYVSLGECLQTRCDVADDFNCDIFVSIHCNAAEDPTVNGTETFIYDYLGRYFPADEKKGSGTSKILNGNTEEEEKLRCDRAFELAFWVQQTLTDLIGTYDRGVKSDTVSSEGAIYVLRHTEMPAALVEVAFKTNPDDFNRLNNDGFRHSVAAGIAKGIHYYFFEGGLTMHLCSAADMVVTDPDGLRISKQLNEIPGATYTEMDLDGDGDLDDQIRIPDRKIGDYMIKVIPEPGVLPTDTYTLKVSLFGIPVIVAENVQISDIPLQPYSIISTATGIIPYDNPKTIKQRVLEDLKVLRATVTDKQDLHRLDEAIDHLTKSLDQDLWVDGAHLDLKHGEKVFNEEKDAVVKLFELLKDKKSTVDPTKLHDFISRLVGADRALASAAIKEAITEGGDPNKINKANEELNKGDRKAADNEFASAIEHYRNAWNHALKALKHVD